VVAELRGRDQVDPSIVRAIDAVVVDGIAITPKARLRARVMQVTAARLENDASLTDAAGLALHLGETLTVVDYEAIASVFPEGNEQVVPACPERPHNREGRAVPMNFGCSIQPQCLEPRTAVSKTDNMTLATISNVPE
jgi:hypothetical protein